MRTCVALALCTPLTAGGTAKENLGWVCTVPVFGVGCTFNGCGGKVRSQLLADVGTAWDKFM